MHRSPISYRHPFQPQTLARPEAILQTLAESPGGNMALGAPGGAPAAPGKWCVGESTVNQWWINGDL